MHSCTTVREHIQVHHLTLGRECTQAQVPTFASVEGSRRESLPHDGFTDVGGDEEGDARA